MQERRARIQRSLFASALQRIPEDEMILDNDNMTINMRQLEDEMVLDNDNMTINMRQLEDEMILGNDTASQMDEPSTMAEWASVTNMTINMRQLVDEMILDNVIDTASQMIQDNDTDELNTMTERAIEMALHTMQMESQTSAIEPRIEDDDIAVVDTRGHNEIEPHMVDDDIVVVDTVNMVIWNYLFRGWLVCNSVSAAWAPEYMQIEHHRVDPEIGIPWLAHNMNVLFRDGAKWIVDDLPYRMLPYQTSHIRRSRAIIEIAPHIFDRTIRPPCTTMNVHAWSSLWPIHDASGIYYIIHA